MAESNLGESVLGVLKTVSGARGRREADGAQVAQTQGILLDNKKKQLLLDDEEDRRVFGAAYNAGYITPRADGEGFEVTPENAARLIEKDSALLEQLTSKEYNPFFSTKGANGNEDITYAGLSKINVPPQPGAIGADGQPATPATRYAINLRRKDGTIAPATANASADPNDTVISLSAEDVAQKLNQRVARMHVAGAAGSDPVLQSLRMKFNEASKAELQAALLKNAPGKVGEDPAGQREFLDMVDSADENELRDMAKDMGLDPDQLEVEAANRWAEGQKAERLGASKKFALNSEDMTAYEGTKEILTNQISRLDRAINEFDAKKAAEQPKNLMTGSAAFNPYAIGSNKKDTNNRTGKGGDARSKLVAERDAAAKQLAGLKPPTRPTMASQMPVTKFAWTKENLKDSIRGALDAPTAEQTAALTKYAKEQGVAQASDLKKLPGPDAQALAWIIATNSPGSEKDKLDIFESLSNYARTGDTKKSPIDAETTISKALNETAQTGILQQNANTAVDNAETARFKALSDIDKDARDYKLRLGELGYKRTVDLDNALREVNKDVSIIREAAVSPDPKNPQSGDIVIKATGPTKEMNTAMTRIRSGMMDATVGSPMQIASSRAYLDALGVYAASVAAKTGDPAFWDMEKKFTNFFLREGAVLPIDSMIANIQFDEYVNGVPSKFRIQENGSGSKSTEAMAGADTIDRFLGPGTFVALEQAATSQEAVNRLQKEGKQVDETTLPAMIAAIRKERGSK